MKLVSSQTIDNHDGKTISDKPEKNEIRSAFAGKISVADSGGSNEWTMHIFFETDISSVDFVVPHAAIVGQSERKGLFSLFEKKTPLYDDRSSPFHSEVQYFYLVGE